MRLLQHQCLARKLVISAKAIGKAPQESGKNLTYALELSVETRGTVFQTLFFLRVADCNDPGLEIQRHQVVDAKF